MANVTVDGWGLHQKKNSVEHYIAGSTESYSSDHTEAAADQASNISYTVGRLVEALIDKGLLDRADLEYIVGASAPRITKLRKGGRSGEGTTALETDNRPE